ncbi:hypothetical protein BH09PSE5_BH09PSE5_02680 [soil metagenome]
MLNLIRKLFVVHARTEWRGRMRLAVPVRPMVEEAPTPDWELGLIPHAQRWLERLPPRERPAQLCLAFPRIGNRLSLLWPSASLIDGYFEDLLVDKRGGRRGFEPGIAEELMRLREYRAQTGDLPDTFFGEPDPVVGHGAPGVPGAMEQTTPGFQARF